MIPATLMFRSTKFLVLDKFAVHCLSSRCHSRPSHPCKSIDAFAAETTNFMQIFSIWKQQERTGWSAKQRK